MPRLSGVQLYTALFLLWCVLSSKHILIYNEETLVALSFFLFVYLVYRYAGDSIGESLDSRGLEVAQELQTHLEARQEALEALVEAHQGATALGVSTAAMLARGEALLRSHGASMHHMVTREVTRGVETRCRVVAQLGGGMESRVLQALAQRVPALVALGHTSSGGVSRDTLQRALGALM